MPFYSFSASNVSLNTSNDLITVIAGAAGRFKLHEVSLAGMGTVSAANEIAVARSSGGTTGGAAQTAIPLVTDSRSALSTNFTTWSVQPTLGNVILRLGVNANGGIYRWVAKPGEEPEWRGSDQLSLRPSVGSSNISWHVVVEEI